MDDVETITERRTTGGRRPNERGYPELPDDRRASAWQWCDRRSGPVHAIPGRAAMIENAVFAPMQLDGGFLWWAIIFFVLAIAAAVAGFQGVAGISMSIAKILVVVFLVLAVVALLI